MRFLHTSDWHLGRLFHGIPLTASQEHVLGQLIALAQTSEVDALVIAGDIFDRAVPPPEAVQLLDEVLSRVVLDLGIPVLAIAGNHDSPERLGFGARLLADRKLHLAGSFSRQPLRVTLSDRFGPVDFFLTPYVEPILAKEILEHEGPSDHGEAFRGIAREIAGCRRPGVRTVEVAHAFVVGGEECESERMLSVGGAGTVEASVFDGMNYVALGHLHRPQCVGRESLRYSGSLLKYSFSEASHQKSVSVVDMDEKGACRVETVSLAPRHDVRRIRGTLAEIRNMGESDPHREDFLEISLSDREALLDPMAQLRKIYPNVLNVLRPALQEAGSVDSSGGDRSRLTDVDLFASFFAQVTGSALEDVHREAFRGVVSSLGSEERAS